MNQQQVRDILLQLDNSVEEFSVIFSGKKSAKVDGLYRPESNEIIIHNLNFSEKQAERLVYTAIHEFSHHIQFTKSKGIISSRAHTTVFWNIFHQLLNKAERLGLYNPSFRENEDLKQKAKEIAGKQQKIAELMKEMGDLLLSSADLCNETGASFEDFIDRELRIKRNDVKAMIKAFQYDVSTNVGPSNMKIVAVLKDENVRRQAENAFQKGLTEPIVKAEVIDPDKYKLQDEDEFEVLKKEKEKTEKQITRRIEHLNEIEERLELIA